MINHYVEYCKLAVIFSRLPSNVSEAEEDEILEQLDDEWKLLTQEERDKLTSDEINTDLVFLNSEQ